MDYKDNHELLIEKITKEIENFRNSYKMLSVQQTYNDWYIIGFYEEYFEMLSTDFLDNRGAEKEIEWLTTLNKPLAYLYEEWMSSDGSFSHDWDDMFEFIHETYTLRSF